ncbi:hypothetical protein HMPREF0653_00492 [Prevotella disiens JCM 6334 = ATCC 29426]|uniref:Uncharacterized protein n=3 Tax=Prevotella disiens TaxID=28130 RepID=A0A096CP60_9BACT|nr:hypothetical protein [Prevotella disiens]ERJ80143.1 hypothetical protein HMPREF0653_00492 [Prevotella disiens JCM 6334 = ATCC 29426]KGF47114.1 hypothetical protein HMPREF0654_10330 [Prevotella disiens DNF00882]SUB85563.1 Uncharacterised protein [Prevotella disiens]
MNLEEKLLSEYGNKRPFKLPEGYFDNLDEQIISQIVEVKDDTNNHEKVNIKPIRRFRPLLIAASFVGLIVVGVASINLFQQYQSAEKVETKVNKLMMQPTSQKKIDSSEMEEAEEYMMIDQDDMYNYLADN